MKNFNINSGKLENFLELEIPGWKKIKIFYGFSVSSGITILHWKIENTDHIFTVPHHILILQNEENLSDHFVKTLKVFRNDFLEWKKEGFPLDWMKKYENMFNDLIL